MVWYGTVRYGMVWHGMARHGMAWYGMTSWYHMISYHTISHDMIWQDIPVFGNFMNWDWTHVVISLMSRPTINHGSSLDYQLVGLGIDCVKFKNLCIIAMVTAPGVSAVIIFIDQVWRRYLYTHDYYRYSELVAMLCTAICHCDILMWTWLFSHYCCVQWHDPGKS